MSAKTGRNESGNTCPMVTKCTKPYFKKANLFDAFTNGKYTCNAHFVRIFVV